MAKYRCLSDAVLYNDNFLSMPATARDLYNYINNKTDDFGFCCEVSSIMRVLKSKPKDLQILLDKKFLIKFEDWLYLEKHFYINNKNLRRDRIKPTNYPEYLGRVILKPNGAYTLRTNGDILQPNDAKPQPNDGVIQYNTIQTNTIQNNTIQSKEELDAILRGDKWKESASHVWELSEREKEIIKYLNKGATDDNL